MHRLFFFYTAQLSSGQNLKLFLNPLKTKDLREKAASNTRKCYYNGSKKQVNRRH